MATPTTTIPIMGRIAGFRRFSVNEYHSLIQSGHLTEDDNLELIEGYLVLKMARNPPHDSAIDLTRESIRPLLPKGWMLRSQQAVTLSSSEPEPDFAAVRGDGRTFAQRHPQPADIGLLIEVSESTLDFDRIDKTRIYARDNIPVYWIVNLIDRQVEVYSQPSGPIAAPAYAVRQDYGAADAVPFLLDGVLLGSIPVRDLLP
jgi:Uma2 family endonuclease